VGLEQDVDHLAVVVHGARSVRKLRRGLRREKYSRRDAISFSLAHISPSSYLARPA
jgi:hypothetical protein